jgi:hypothetical protein
MADVIVRTFTSAQSATPTPIITAVASTFPHWQGVFSNTGTAGDFVTVYMNGTTKQVYVAPGANFVKSFIATSANQAVSIGGGNTAGASIVVWGVADLQTYQVPPNLPSQ